MPPWAISFCREVMTSIIFGNGHFVIAHILHSHLIGQATLLDAELLRNYYLQVVLDQTAAREALVDETTAGETRAAEVSEKTVGHGSGSASPMEPPGVKGPSVNHCRGHLLG